MLANSCPFLSFICKHTHMHTQFFSYPFPLLSQIMNIVPCAIQYDLVCLLYILQFASANHQLPIYACPTFPLLVITQSALYVCESVSVSQISSFVSYFRVHVSDTIRYLSFSFFLNFYFYFILFYNTVLFLPYIDMNLPRVYMSSQS